MYTKVNTREREIRRMRIFCWVFLIFCCVSFLLCCVWILYLAGVFTNVSRQKCEAYREFSRSLNLTCERTVPESNGEFIQPGEFPHVVLLRTRYDKDSVNYACVGTLISDSYVATATYCNGKNIMDDPWWWVRVGAVDDQSGQLIEATSISTQPVFLNLLSTIRAGEMTLIQLKEPVQFTESVRPACLPYDYGFFESESNMIGIGKDFNNKLTKRTLRNPHSFKGCQKIEEYSYAKECLIDQSGNSTDCYSGPVYTQLPDCTYKLIAVNTGRRLCRQGDEKSPASVYTKVRYFVSWFEKNVWPHESHSTLY